MDTLNLKIIALVMDEFTIKPKSVTGILCFDLQSLHYVESNALGKGISQFGLVWKFSPF